MTLIVGLVHEGKVYMGADSAGVSGLNVNRRKDKKIFKVGDFIIGGTTSFRMLQILQFSFVPPRFIDLMDLPNNPEAGKDIFEYMCTDFVDTLRACFENKGFGKVGGEDGDEGGTFLVGYRDRLFCIDSDYQVIETIDPYNSIGCGKYYAIGALYVLNGLSIQDKLRVDLKPRKIVERALYAGCQYSGGVSKPFNYEIT